MVSASWAVSGSYEMSSLNQKVMDDVLGGLRRGATGSVPKRLVVVATTSGAATNGAKNWRSQNCGWLVPLPHRTSDAWTWWPLQVPVQPVIASQPTVSTRDAGSA